MLAGDAAVVVDDLHYESLRVGVVVALFPEFHLALAEFLDDLLGGERRRLVSDVAGIACRLGGCRGRPRRLLRRTRGLRSSRCGRRRQRALLLRREHAGPRRRNQEQSGRNEESLLYCGLTHCTESPRQNCFLLLDLPGSSGGCLAAQRAPQDQLSRVFLEDSKWAAGARSQTNFTISISPCLRRISTAAPSLWRRTSRFTEASAIVRFSIITSSRPGGRSGLAKQTCRSAARTLIPKHARSSKKTDPAAQACGAQATGYSVGLVVPGRLWKPQKSSGMRLCSTLRLTSKSPCKI